MRVISLPPKDHTGYLSYINDHLADASNYSIKHKYAIVTVIAVVAIFALLFVIQNTAASMQRNAAAQAALESATDTNHKVESNPITIESQSTPDQASNSNSEVKTELKINNQPVPVPSNGTVQKTIVTDNGTTNVNISVNSDTNGSSQSSSSTSFELDTSTQTEATVTDSE